MCVRTVLSAGGLAWCRGDELGTTPGLTRRGLWTNWIGAQAPTLHPQICVVVHTFIHRCESMVEGSRNRSLETVAEPPITRPKADGGTYRDDERHRISKIRCRRRCDVGYLLERCLILAVNSWTWSYTLRRSVISLRIFLSAYITVV